MTKRESFTSGVLFMLLSATGLSLTGLLGKFGVANMPLFSLIFWRYIASFFICFGLLWFTKRLRKPWSLGNIKMHFLRAFFVLIAQYSFYYYLAKSTLLNATVLLNTGPIFIPLIEWGFLRHKVGKSSWVGIIVSFLGVLCILQPDAGIFSLLSLVGLMAGIGQGASQVVFGLNSQEERSDLSVLYLFFLCVCFSLFPYLFASSSHSTEKEWVPLLIIALGIASLGTQFTRTVAYRHGTPSKLASFLYFSVLLAGIFDWTIFHKVPNTLSLIGTGLVVLGGVLKIYLRFIILKKSR